MARACSDFCPVSYAADYNFECSAPTHVHHSSYYNWQAAQSIRPSLQWGLFFLIISILFGALFRCSARCCAIPYTVGLLIVFFLLGLVGGRMEYWSHCPHHAFAYDDNHDSMISREEFARFQGVGFHPESFCIVGDLYGRNLGATNDRTCGDGSANPRACVFTFEDLDKPFKLSSMLSTRANRNGEGDDLLSADELWRPSCNLIHSMVTLTDMDPHLMLTIFLPSLLFESAAFGIDVRARHKCLNAASTKALHA